MIDCLLLRLTCTDVTDERREKKSLFQRKQAEETKDFLLSGPSFWQPSSTGLYYLHRAPVSGRSIPLCMIPDCAWDEQTVQCLVSGFQLHAKCCNLLALFRLIQSLCIFIALHYIVYE